MATYLGLVNQATGVVYPVTDVQLALGPVAAPSTTLMNTVQPTLATVVPLTLKGYTAQSANLQEWQNSSGTVLASISSSGDLTKIAGVAYAWPTSQGAAGTRLQNNGSGTLSWEAYVPATEVTFVGVNVQPGYEITLDKVIDYIWSSGRVYGFALTDNGNGTINLAYGTAMLRTGDTMSPFFSPLVACYIAAQTNIALTDNTTNFVYAYYNGGSPTIAVSTDITTIHATDKVLLYVVTRVGTQLDYLSVGSYQSDFMAKYAKKITARNQGAEYAYGCVTTESDTRKIAVTTGAFYFVNEQIAVPAFDTNASSTFTYIYRAATPGTYTRVAGQTTIDRTNYDNGSGTLAALSNNNRFGVHWVFLVLDAPTRMIVVYGQGDYATASDAEAAGIPTDLPPEVRAYSTGVLIAKILVQKTGTNFYEILNPFTTKFTSAVATAHNQLAGLQGGTTNEFYHLTSAQHAIVVNNCTVQSLTASGTIAAGKVKFTGSTASQTLTLPAGASGTQVCVRNAASVAVSVARAGADTIEGETTLTLNPGESVLLTFIGTDWTVF